MTDDSLLGHEYFMREALKEAHLALHKYEIPIGAVIVCKNRIIARAHNLVETLNDPTAHAEMQAITAATNTLGSKYLTECSLYVTIEPCAMCAAACFWAQIGTVVYGARDEKRGFSTVSENMLHPKTLLIKGIFAGEASELMTDFFKKRRYRRQAKQ